MIDLETSINYDREKDNGTLLSAKLRICDWNNINEKINEYKEYRNSECTLDNGYTPPIINGIIN